MLELEWKLMIRKSEVSLPFFILYNGDRWTYQVRP